ncbi:MAG: hypothetical protein HZB10_03780 [Candidatus Yonathbacteria bacterium]|nr:hypothetical protein [Candidatus Yonathbacteria bacterium]
MNITYPVRLILLFLLWLLVVVSTQAKALTDTKRKELANAEYSRCMSIAEKDGVYAVVAYVRESQKGTLLIGTAEKLAQENCVADAIGLNRYEDIDEIIEDYGNLLVPIATPLIRVGRNVPLARHVARPWTRDYLVELSQYLKQNAPWEKGTRPDAQILVASTIRSRVDQKRITRTTMVYRYIKGKFKKFFRSKQSFADCSTKAVCSTHLTGASVDVSLLGANGKKRALLAERLLDDRENGRILVIEERAGNHFHVFVIPPLYVVPLKDSS